MNIIYSTIIGDIDRPQESFKADGWKYLMFHQDATAELQGWESRIVVNTEGLTARRLARAVKFLPHQFLGKDIEYSIFIDGNTKLIQHPQKLIDCLGDNDVAFFDHVARDCIYKEAQEVIDQRKDIVENVNPLMDFYEQEGYPTHNGLAKTGVFIRRHTPKVIGFNNLCWSLISKYSQRDQLVVNYVLWKLGMKYSIIPKDYESRKDVVIQRKPHTGIGKFSY